MQNDVSYVQHSWMCGNEESGVRCLSDGNEDEQQNTLVMI